MAVTYLVAIGHDQGSGMEAVVPQPACPGIKPTLRTLSASGYQHDQGLWTEYIFSAVESVTQYQAILAQFDLDDNLSSPVTVQVRDDQFTATTKNAMAQRPEIDEDVQWEMPFPRDVHIRLTNLATPS